MCLRGFVTTRYDEVMTALHSCKTTRIIAVNFAKKWNLRLSWNRITRKFQVGQ